MDKYRLVDEQYIGAQGFIDESKLGGTPAPPTDSDAETECTVRITPQAKPRSCITTAMNIFVSVSRTKMRSFTVFTLMIRFSQTRLAATIMSS